MTSSSKRLIEFFYDIASPYSWIGFETLIRYQQKWNIDLVLKPVFAGGLMAAAENQAPATNARKAQYMIKDLERLSKYYQVPVNLNDLEKPMSVIFGSGTLVAQRLISAVDMKTPEYVEELSRQLWMRMWKTSEDVRDAESLLEAGKRAGMSEAVISDAVSRVKNQDVKDRLKDVTDEALEHGAFGIPLIVVHVDGQPHVFFGSDRLHLVAMLLGEKYEGPLTLKL